MTTRKADKKKPLFWIKCLEETRKYNKRNRKAVSMYGFVPSWPLRFKGEDSRTSWYCSWELEIGDLMAKNSLNLIANHLGFPDHNVWEWITPYKTHFKEELGDTAYYGSRRHSPSTDFGGDLFPIDFPDGPLDSKNVWDTLMMTIVCAYIHNGRLKSRMKSFETDFLSGWRK